MEFFVDFCIFGMLAYDIHNKEKKLKQSDHFYFWLFSAVFGIENLKCLVVKENMAQKFWNLIFVMFKIYTMII